MWPCQLVSSSFQLVRNIFDQINIRETPLFGKGALSEVTEMCCHGKYWKIREHSDIINIWKNIIKSKQRFLAVKLSEIVLRLFRKVILYIVSLRRERWNDEIWSARLSRSRNIKHESVKSTLPLLLRNKTGLTCLDCFQDTRTPDDRVVLCSDRCVLVPNWYACFSQQPQSAIAVSYPTCLCLLVLKATESCSAQLSLCPYARLVSVCLSLKATESCSAHDCVSCNKARMPM